MAKGIRFQKQTSNPLPNPTDCGIWTNNAGELIYENGTTSENISQRLDDLESGASLPITAGVGLTKTGNDIFVNVDDSTIEIDVDTLRVKDLGITTVKIDDGAVDEDKINSSIAGDGLAGGSGSPLSVNVDNTTLEITADTLNVKALGINTAQLADGAVDEDKLNASVAGNGLTGGAGSPLAVGAGNGVQVNSNDIEVLHAPSTKVTVTVGQSMTANMITLVRWALDGEVAGRVYKATALDASDGKYIVIGGIAPTVALSAGDTTTLVMSGELALGSSDLPFGPSDVGKDLFLRTDGTGSFTLVPSTTEGDAQYKIGTVKSTTSIWLGDAYLKAVVPAELYDEEIYYASGLAANTPITLPGGKVYNQISHELQVFVNGIMKFQGTDWTSTSSTQVEFPIALANNSRVVFRIIPPASGTLTGGGGGGSLQDAYEAGPTITIASGVPLTINGPVSEKLLVINGSITVSDVIDPTALQLTPQATNPMNPGDKGIWANMSGDLVYENGVAPTNVSSILTSVENGTALTYIAKTYINNTGSTIPAYTVVYTNLAGEIDVADGGNVNKFRAIGITVAAIADGASGAVAISGIVTGISGLTHNSYAYLGNTPGDIVDTPPNSPSGFNVVRLGVVDDDSVLLQIQHVGTLV
jgi:hypothetical protein